MRLTALRKLGSAAALLLSLTPAATQAVPLIWESDFGTNLDLTDDDTANLSWGFNFNFLGTSYTGGAVSSNGFQWLGVNAGSECCSGDVATFLSESPRIALAWYDHVPAGANNVYFNSFGDRAVITWNNVSAFDDTTVIFTGQIQLHDDGRIVFGYDSFFNNGGVDDQVLIGVTGGGADPGESDLFAGPFDTGTTSTVYQLLNDGLQPQVFDFSDRNICFTPNGSNGWLVNNCQTAAVPEPSGLALLGLGFLALGVTRRRSLRLTRER